MEIKRQLEKSELVGQIERYSLYYDKKSSEISIYNGEELYYVSLLKLSEAVFKQEG